MPAMTPRVLDAQPEEWQQQLHQWAGDSCAAREALQLEATANALHDLKDQWMRGDFQDLPPLASLPPETIPGAGVYAIAAGEELVHLDARLNPIDTTGEEGELFALLLLPGEPPTATQQIAEHTEMRAWVQSTPIPPASPRRTRHEVRNSFALAALRSDGSVVTWGDPLHGGDTSGVDFDGPDNNLAVSQIFSTSYAFAALRSDGSVVTWG